MQKREQIENTINQLFWDLYDSYYCDETVLDKKKKEDIEYAILSAHHQIAKKLGWVSEQGIRVQMKYYEDPNFSVLNGTGYHLAF